MKTLIVVLLIFSKIAFCKDLTEVALFQRCYTHLTQTSPHKHNSLLIKIKNGQLTAKSACWQLLDETKFNSNNNSTIADVNNIEARKVLKVFHNLHFSWFSTKYFPEIIDDSARNVNNIYDVSSPALYFTKALFTPQTSFASIFSGDETYRSIRHLGERHDSVTWPVHSSSSDIIRGIRFASRGDLIGIETMTKNETHEVWAKLADNQPATQWADVNINAHWGGGVLGNQVYLLQNIDAPDVNFTTDGGVKSNRKWARSVFHDFFCRELPAVRESDGAPYVLGNSPLSYRNSKGCVKCHASSDTMAGIVRNAKYERTGYFFDPGGHYVFLSRVPASAPARSYFPEASDPDFYKRPSTGNLYYRTYNGELIFREASDLNTLGSYMLELDDAYICAAKRYFEYFTGISANITDVKDPANPNFPQLSSHQQKYRDVVVNLGKSLKTHKNLKLLIKDIIEHPVYSSENFKLSE